MPRFDISTIGEGQIRLTCHKGDRLVTARELRMTAACSEANVAGLLSQLGRSASWASVMPRGELGERVLDEFRSVGVHLGNIVRTERGRVALYFMEPGEYPMPAKVIYDRLYTPFRDAGIEDFDWESMLDARLVFVTGITAALTENTARVVGYFVDKAAERGIDVALDVNYRSLLWDADSARRVLEPIARKSSIVFCSRSDGTRVFGIPGDGMTVCRTLREAFDVPVVVSTARSTASTCPPPRRTAGSRSCRCPSSTGPAPATPSSPERSTASSTATSRPGSATACGHPPTPSRITAT